MNKRLGAIAMSESEATDEPKQARIVRDSTFCRFAADRMIVSFLGRDLEVAFLQMGPLFHTLLDSEHDEEFQAEPSLTEVARMRIGFREFFSEFMNFARVGILSGHVKGESVANQILEWSKEAGAEEINAE